MAFNGLGVFVRLYNWAADALANVKISSSRMDAEMDGMAAGLTNAICKDGQSTCTSSIPFAQGITLPGGTLGIGMVPVNILDITQTQNALSKMAIANASAGAAAGAESYYTNGTTIFEVGILGTGYTPAGVLRAAGSYARATGAGGLTLVTGAAQPIYFGVNDVDVGRWTSSGLGIGMTPSNILDITQTQNAQSVIGILNNTNNTAAGAGFKAVNNTPSSLVMRIMSGGFTPSGIDRADGGQVTASGSGGLTVGTTGAQPLYLVAGGALGALLNASNQFVVGAAAAIGSEMFQVKQAGGATAVVARLHNNATSGDNQFLEFGTEASFTARGSIDYNRGGGAVRYNTTSDAAFKANVADAKEETKAALIKSVTDIKLREYEMVDNPGEVTHGLVAQELFEAYPNAVSPGYEREIVINEETGEKRTETVPWMYDRSMLVLPLLAAVQEQAKRIEALEARVGKLP